MVCNKVPINVYPVTWSSLPDADWPEQCDDDTETQGERAFDPFVPCLGLGKKKRLPAFCCKSVAWGKWLYSSLVRCFCEGCRVSENVAMCWIFCCWGIGGSHG